MIDHDITQPVNTTSSDMYSLRAQRWVGWYFKPANQQPPPPLPVLSLERLELDDTKALVYLRETFA